MNGTYPSVTSTYPLRTFGSSSFLVNFTSLFMKAQGVEYINIYIYIYIFHMQEMLEDCS
jgi:hypothetical protein